MRIHGYTSDIGAVPLYRKIYFDTTFCLSLELDLYEQVWILETFFSFVLSPFTEIQLQTIKINHRHEDAWGHIIYQYCHVVS